MNPDDVPQNLHLQVRTITSSAAQRQSVVEQGPGRRHLSLACKRHYAAPHYQEDTRSRIQLMGYLKQVANLNDAFSFPPNYVDLVNSRFVANGIAATRWPAYMLDIKRYVLLNFTRHVKSNQNLGSFAQVVGCKW
jgi:hypothetical protein